MRKNTILSLLLLSLLIVAGLSQLSLSEKSVSEPDSTLESEVLSATPDPASAWSTPLFEGDQVKLIPNFKEQLTSEEIQRANNCQYVVNAGFYTKEQKPVGLFQTDGVTLRGSHESSLFDSFFSINAFGTPRITRSLPSDNLRLAIQVGPMIVENSFAKKLTIRNDKLARRVAVFVTGENKVGFVIVRSSLLADLPAKIIAWSQENSIVIADAVNLDGGSASAFRSPTVILPEISPIGSAFCVQ